MASVLGAGTPLAAAWLLDPTTPAGATPRADEQPHAPPPAGASTDAPETLDVLARTVAALRRNRAGLSLTELRLLLAEPTDAVQRAIAAGLRTKQLRRMGSRNELRYLGNG